MDPGRKKYEWREIQYIAVGDIIMTDTGVAWGVQEVSDETLFCFREHNGLHIETTFSFTEWPLVKCKTDMGPTH